MLLKFRGCGSRGLPLALLSIGVVRMILCSMQTSILLDIQKQGEVVYALVWPRPVMSSFFPMVMRPQWWIALSPDPVT